jgi:uncharacterized membrane protein YqaE (UPF0057 family)
MLRNFLFLLFSVALLSSCTIEKRKHFSGYHVQWHTSLKKAEKSTNTIVDEKEIELASNNIIEKRNIDAQALNSEDNKELAEWTPPVIHSPALSFSKKAEKQISPITKVSSIHSAYTTENRVAHRIIQSVMMKQQRDSDDADLYIFLAIILLAIILPPCSVFLHQGCCNSFFWYTVDLTLLGWIPGIVYAFIIIFTQPRYYYY